MEGNNASQSEKNILVSFRISKNNATIKRWVEAQTNLSKSIKKLIDDSIKQQGFVDLSIDMLPGRDKIELEMLKYLSQNKDSEIGLPEIYEQIGIALNIPYSLRKATSTGSNESIYEKRIRAIKYDLKKKECIKCGENGVMKITETGLLATKLGGSKRLELAAKSAAIQRIINKN